MKNKLYKLLFLLPAVILTSCGGNRDNSSEVSSAEIVSISMDKEDELSVGGSYGGYFTEFSVGRTFCSNTEYEFTFESSYSKDTSYTVTSSRPESVRVLKESPTSKKFILATGIAGDSIITIKDAREMLCFRKVMHVRDPYSSESIVDAMFEKDYFQSISLLGDYKLSITGTAPTVSGILQGGDDWESNVQTTFDLSYSEFIPATDCYLFNIETTKTNVQTRLTSLCVTRCCDTMYLYYLTGGEEHLLTILFPNDIFDQMNNAWLY